MQMLEDARQRVGLVRVGDLDALVMASEGGEECAQVALQFDGIDDMQRRTASGGGVDEVVAADAQVAAIVHRHAPELGRRPAFVTPEELSADDVHSVGHDLPRGPPQPPHLSILGAPRLATSHSIFLRAHDLIIQRMRLALGLYCVFIIYGSLIPFDFSFSAETAGHQLAKVHVLPFSGGQRVWSVADMASNIALFVPFGLLLAAARGHGQKPVRVLGLVTVASLAFGTAVESAQLFLPSRTASPVDVACETIGGIGGGFLALYWLRGGLAHAMLRGPLWSVLTVLAVALMVDRWYPFAATLDVSTAMQSLRHAQLVPFARWSPDQALDALVPQQRDTSGPPST